MSDVAAQPLDSNADATPDAVTLARVLDSYLAGLQAGRPADPEGLIAAHPDLAGPLRARLKVMRGPVGRNDESGPAADSLAAVPDGAGIVGMPGRIGLTRCGTCGRSSPSRPLPDPPGDDLPVVLIRNDASPDFPDGAGAGRYQVLSEIARGGMGVVLRARDVELGRDLALKVLQARHLDNPGVVDRFLEEARISGQLQHPGIVPVHELGTLADRRPYFTMKLVNGRTLAALLADRGARPDPSPVGAESGRGTEPPAAGTTPAAATGDLARFLAIFEQVCQPVAYAHARHVIHRDLKPSNVMVGHFGEVQVVDWGLAKILTECGGADGEQAMVGGEMTIHATRCGSPGSGGESWPGIAMGTPSYMAPEQARGEVARIDERADVFGLGAILCEILTGRPPFGGFSRDEVCVKAALGVLTGAMRRLEASGADAELIGLARDCLAVEPEHRPRCAGGVARRMASYQAGVQDRLAEAERARVQAQTRAEEERKRRRLTVALTASLLGLCLLGGGSSAYLARQRMEQAARLDRASSGVELMFAEANRAGHDLTRWFAAREAALALEGLLVDSPAGPTRDRLAALVRDVARAAESAESDQKLLTRLVDIRGAESDDPAGTATDARYAEAFRVAGLDVIATPTDEVAAKIRARPATVRVALAAALDDWAAVSWIRRHDEGGARPFIEIARLADPDPWRNRLREVPGIVSTAERLSRVQELARSAQFDLLPPVSLFLLGKTLFHLGDPTGAEAVLRKAVTRYPGDVWMNYGLGECLERLARPEEAMRYFTAARSLRPETGHYLAHLLAERGETDQAIAIFQDLTRLRPDDGTHLGCLGGVLQDRGRTRGAQDVLDKAITILAAETRRDPLRPDAHINLALALIRRGRRGEAIAEYREAIRIEPGHAEAHYCLGHALIDRADRDEAIAEYREAIRLRPDYSEAHNNLGQVLLAQGNRDEAIGEFREALRSKPDLAEAHSNLGLALRDRGQLDAAMAECREAIRLKPRDAEGHGNLGLALRDRGQLDAAIAAFREAVRLKPDHAMPRYNLGNALGDQGRLDAAIGEYIEAIRLRPDFAEAHTNLGNALARRGELDRAIVELHTALRLDPGLAEAHGNLGNTLRRQGKLDEAIAELHECLRLKPDDAEGRTNLGLTLYDMRKFDEANAELRAAIRRKPDLLEARYGLANTLFAQRKMDEAIAEYREAIRLKPDYPEAHTNLGNVLRNQGRLPEAAAEYRTALRFKPDLPEAHANLGLLLRSQGDPAGAVAELRKARDLARLTNRRLVERIEHELTAAEQDASQSARVQAILGGRIKPADAAETLGLARSLHEKKRYGASARSWSEAFQARPDLAEDLQAAHRYDAACAAALAGCGLDEGEPPLDGTAKAGWRKQALDWIEADLKAWSNRLKRDPAQARPAISKALQHWRADADLAGLRDPESLGKLPKDEQDACRSFWKEVDALLARAGRSDGP